MKLLDIALKDLTQATRNFMIFVFAFVVPILVTLLFAVMFGGFSSDDDQGFELPTTDVILVNLDEGRLPAGAFQDLDLPGGESASPGDALSMGDLLTQILQSDALADLMTVTTGADEVAARSAVDNQDTNVAIIIPPNFTDAITQPEMSATVEMYQDPTLTFGPAIVGAIMNQVLDNFAAGKIGLSVIIEDLIAAGISPDPSLVQRLVGEMNAALNQQSGDGATLITVRAPAGVETSGSIVGEMLGLIMGGMMVFFAFFTGSASMETILTEEERGTLPRLFTTPTGHRTILTGKSLAVLVTLVVQIAVLMTFGQFVFGIDWGTLPAVLLAGLGIVLTCAATGLFLVSLLKNTRQTGIVFGGVLTITGMIGLIPVFTSGIPDQPAAVKTASLLVPQGWAMRSLMITMDGGTAADVLPTLLVLLGWTLVFAVIGQYRMARRFA